MRPLFTLFELSFVRHHQIEPNRNLASALQLGVEHVELIRREIAQTQVRGKANVVSRGSRQEITSQSVVEAAQK